MVVGWFVIGAVGGWIELHGVEEKSLKAIGCWQLAVSLKNLPSGEILFMKDFRNLEVWDKAHKLSLEMYKITRQFPKEEIYGLTN
jgi:hypothetical protein